MREMKYQYFYLPLLKKLILICESLKYSVMGRFGPTEIILIIAVILLMFGGKKIPELMKGLGSGIKEFKNAAKEDPTADKKEEEKK